MSSTKSRGFVFTVNNYTDDDILLISSSGGHPSIKYLVFGKEISESGTPHLQGYIEFHNSTAFTRAKTFISSRAHLEKRKGTPTEAAAYCKKDGDFMEFGAAPVGQGVRTDIEKIRSVAREGGMRAVVDVADSFQLVRSV